MARKPRAEKRRVEGVWQVDSGTARVLADPARDGAYLLEVNDVPSSHVVLGAPRVLDFEYMQWIAGLLRPLPLDDARILHLGGAACSLARWAADVWPGSRNTVVEVDGALLRLVRGIFDIPDTVTGVVGEARNVTHALPAASIDVLIRDVFAGPVTPRHLTTVEYFRACRRALAPAGLYLANCGDREGLPAARAELAGLAEVFGHVAAIGPAEMLAGRAYGNVVLLASDSPLPAWPGGPVLLRDASELPTGRARRDGS